MLALVRPGLPTAGAAAGGDRDGTELVKLKKRLVRARHRGHRAARRHDRHGQEGDHRTAAGPVHVQLAGGEELGAQGNILDHEYQITRSGIPVANISKRWFRVRKSYGVAVAPGQDDALALAVHGLHRPPRRLGPPPSRGVRGGRAGPEILFVCTHNAGRSQMAAALLDRYAQGRGLRLGLSA